MGQALDFISRHSAPGQYILGLPEGSSLNFLGRRPAPLRYEILTPGFLDPEGEWQAVRALQQKDVPLVFLFNRPTDEFGPRVFGRDYYRILMGWIEENYDLAAVFTPRSAAPIVDIHRFARLWTSTIGGRPGNRGPCLLHQMLPTQSGPPGTPNGLSGPINRWVFSIPE